MQPGSRFGGGGPGSEGKGPRLPSHSCVSQAHVRGGTMGLECRPILSVTLHFPTSPCFLREQQSAVMHKATSYSVSLSSSLNRECTVPFKNTNEAKQRQTQEPCSGQVRTGCWVCAGPRAAATGRKQGGTEERELNFTWLLSR